MPDIDNTMKWTINGSDLIISLQALHNHMGILPDMDVKLCAISQQHMLRDCSIDHTGAHYKTFSDVPSFGPGK